MTKDSFLSELKTLLNDLPDAEQQDILYDYEEHIRMAMDDGATEHAAVQSLGSVRAIAKDILAGYYVKRVKSKARTTGFFQATLVAIGLGFFNVIFILGPLIGLIGLLCGLGGASLGLIIGPPCALVGMFWHHVPIPISSPWLIVFGLMVLEGLGVLLLCLTIALGGVLGNWILRYLRLNIRLIRGGDVNVR